MLNEILSLHGSITMRLKVRLSLLQSVSCALVDLDCLSVECSCQWFGFEILTFEKWLLIKSVSCKTGASSCCQIMDDDGWMSLVLLSYYLCLSSQKEMLQHPHEAQLHYKVPSHSVLQYHNIT